MAQRDLLHLTPAECFDLLGTARVGRLVYVDDEGPLAVPVNYVLADKDIMFRVEGGAKHAAMSQPVLGFEVDHIDDDDQSGWSVLARGAGREVQMADVSDLLRRIEGSPPVPWAFGVHNVWLRLTPSVLTGRRLGPPKDGTVFF